MSRALLLYWVAYASPQALTEGALITHCEKSASKLGGEKLVLADILLLWVYLSAELWGKTSPFLRPGWDASCNLFSWGRKQTVPLAWLARGQGSSSRCAKAGGERRQDQGYHWAPIGQWATRRGWFSDPAWMKTPNKKIWVRKVLMGIKSFVCKS